MSVLVTDHKILNFSTIATLLIDEDNSKKNANNGQQSNAIPFIISIICNSCTNSDSK